MSEIKKDVQFYKFSLYGFLKNLRFFDAFFVLYLRECGVTFAQIGILYSIRELFINIFEIPSGIFADAYGRKTCLQLSFIFYIGSFLIFAEFTTFPMLLIAFVLYAFAESFRSGTNKGMIVSYLRSTGSLDVKSDYYGHTRSWSQMGSAISSLIAGGILFYSGSYRAVFFISIIPYLLNFILISSYPNFLNGNHADKRDYFNSFRAILTLFKKSLFNRRLFALLNTSALHTAYLKAVKDYIQLVMVTLTIYFPLGFISDGKKREGVTVALLYFVVYIITSIASAKSYSLTKHIKNLYFLAYITAMVGFSAGILSGVFYGLNIPSVSLILFIVIYFIENIRKPFLTGLVADSVPVEVVSSIMSVQSQLKTVLVIFIAMFFGFTADKLGPFVSLSAVSGILLLFYCILVYAESKFKKSLDKKE